MRRHLADMAVSVFALVVSAAMMTALPVDVPGAGFTSLGDMSSPAFFPALAAILVSLSAIALLVRSLAEARLGLNDIPSGSDSDLVNGSRRHFDYSDLKGPALMLAACIAYIPLIHTLGMITASGLVIVILPSLFGYRDWRWIAVVAVSVPIAVYVLFERTLKVLFPHGAIF
ncbi:MAG: tripartite tricarboxylate transporter TctB family protein [Hyphomicrobiaceae bacterium TMED74]|nr:hypothetical protein [Filomicrobium sp.]RPG47161.1 MAG: tripartite tricarboxylate transporter TctB family protein [Hyphomicrobiaceae bacterium TMED74]